MFILFNFDFKFLIILMEYFELRVVDIVMTLTLYENKEKLRLHELALFFL